MKSDKEKPKDEQKTAALLPKTWNWEKTTAIWTIVLGLGTIVLGLGTIVLAVVGMYGLNITRTQIRESDSTNAKIFTKIDSISNSFKILAEATKKQTETSIKTVAISDSSLLVSKNMLDFSKKSVEIENRPLVVITSYYDYLPDIEKPGGGLTITVRNYGHTPAYVTYAMGVIISTKEDFIRKMNTIYTPKRLEFIASICKEHIVLETEQTTEITDREQLKITKEELTEISKGKMSFYIYGDIQYNDFFGNHYYSHFCGLMDNSTGGFSFIGKYNDAD